MILSDQTVNNFTPWHTDYRYALGWYAGGVAVSWALVAWGGVALAVVVAIWSLMRGWARAKRGMARERGVVIERRACEMLEALPESDRNFYWRNVRMTARGVCYGDIDLIVNTPWTKMSFVVEIKSYPGVVKRWYGLCRSDKYYRLWSELKQVRRQCKYLGSKWHRPVLWMPESKLNNWRIHRGLLIVNGGPEVLMESLKIFNSYTPMPVILTFQGLPKEYAISYVKRKGFVYNPREYRWYGMATMEQQSVIPQMFTEFRTVIELQRREAKLY